MVQANPDYKGVCHVALAQEGHCRPGEVLLHLLHFGPLQESTSPCVWSCNFGPLQETKSPRVWIIQLGSPNTNSEDVGWV
jgi:hypothetical protein